MSESTTPDTNMTVKAAQFLGALNDRKLPIDTWPSGGESRRGPKFSLPYGTAEEKAMANEVFSLMEGQLAACATDELRHGIERMQTPELVTIYGSYRGSEKGEKVESVSFSVTLPFLERVKAAASQIDR